MRKRGSSRSNVDGQTNAKLGLNAVPHRSLTRNRFMSTEMSKHFAFWVGKPKKSWPVWMALARPYKRPDLPEPPGPWSMVMAWAGTNGSQRLGAGLIASRIVGQACGSIMWTDIGYCCMVDL